MQALELNFEKGVDKVIQKLEQKGAFPEILSFLKAFNNEDNIECQTSGTTGTPKIILLEKEKMILSAKATISFFSLKPGMKALLALSPIHIAGKMMITRAIIGKLKLFVISPSANIFSYDFPEIDFTPLVPYQLNKIEDQNLKKLGIILLGGAPADQPTIDRLIKNNITAYASFGMTETISHFALKKISPIQEKHFKTLPDYFVSSGTENNLIITNKNMLQHDLVTKESVSIINNREFQWLGRIDNVINSGGIKLHPEDIEAKLNPHIHSDFIISSVNDKLLGDKLVLVTLNSSKEQVSKINFDQILGKYEAPKKIIFVDVFPKTDTGKIKRLDVKKMINK